MVFIFIDSFLLYMTVRFSKEKLTSDSVDPLTSKKVPTVVFLQNHMLLVEAMKNNFALDSAYRHQLRLKAQMNEYMYYLLKQQRIKAQINEDIGIDFIDFS